jgi:hypothetical protein
MRHITDGELHIYLDGALDLLDESRGEDIREHLTHCPVCRERLQDEEQLRTRAQELLRDPPVEAGPLPAFEELRARADLGVPEGISEGEESEPPTKYRGPLQGLPLAWAATIVLALGVGWMGGQVNRFMPAGFSARIPAMDADALTAPGGEAPVVSEEEDPSAPIVDPGTGELEVAEAQGEIASRAEGAGEGPPMETPSAKVVALTEPEEGLRGEAEGVMASAARQRTDSIGSVSAPPSLIAEPTADLSELERREVAATAPPGGEVADSLSSEGSSLVVPGLEVLSMAWEDWFPGERALHIRQLLPMGDTLELRYLGMLIGMDPEGRPKRIPGVLQESLRLDKPLSPVVMQASLPPGWNQVVMPLGNGWLVARAPLPEATIRALVNIIH